MQYFKVITHNLKRNLNVKLSIIVTFVYLLKSITSLFQLWLYLMQKLFCIYLVWCSALPISERSRLFFFIEQWYFLCASFNFSIVTYCFREHHSGYIQSIILFSFLFIEVVIVRKNIFNIHFTILCIFALSFK